jgi:hypothetical protein
MTIGEEGEERLRAAFTAAGGFGGCQQYPMNAANILIL